MTALSVPEGYSARPPRMDDAAGVGAVMTACMTEITAEELADDWEQIDLADQAVIVIAPDGRIVASGDILNRRYVRVSMYGYVHPDERGRGLGSFLVGWAERWTRERMSRAPDGVQVVLEFYANRADEASHALLEARGYPLVRTVYVMQTDLDRPPEQPTWPQAFRVRTFEPGTDDQALLEVGENAFQDTWSRPPGTLEGWLSGTQAGSFDPSLWFLAEDERGDLAGFCLCLLIGSKGWVRSLGVHRESRGRGLGLALLQHAFGELRRRGAREVGLSVDADSPTGAPRLYTRAGMQVTERYGVYRRQIRPGLDFTTALAGS